MLKPSTMSQNRSGCLFIVLITAVVLLFAWGLPALGQDDTAVAAKNEGAPPEPSAEADLGQYETEAPQEALYPSAPPPTYAGQVPASPVEPLIPEESNPRRTWLWAGCGCAVVLVCVLVGSAFVFDSINLYCTPPFRSAMELIGAVCP
jgi:hypothetical protein